MEALTLDEKIKQFLAVNSGSGSGSGDGSGYGDGYGYGSKILKFLEKTIYKVDNVNTIITSVKGNAAKGFILQNDLTMTPCFIVKGEIQGKTVFAHGDDLHQAMQALTDKMFDGMSAEERVKAFIKEHPDYNQAYPNQDLFDWHHRLTGSCLAGRNAFVKDHELSLDGSTTVAAFIDLTRNAYGGDVIRMLEKAYRDKEA